MLSTAYAVRPRPRDHRLSDPSHRSRHGRRWHRRLRTDRMGTPPRREAAHRSVMRPAAMQASRWRSIIESSTLGGSGPWHRAVQRDRNL